MNADYGTGRLTCFDHRHVSPRPFSEHNPHSVAPSLVDAEQYPINLWRDVMQQRVGGRMHMQSRGVQENIRSAGTRCARDAMRLVPSSPDPVMASECPHLL